MRYTHVEGELPPTFAQLIKLVLLDMCMPKGIFGAVPRWMLSLSSLSFLRITVGTMGEEDLQVLGSMPSLSDLYIWVNGPTQGRDGRLIIDNGYPFRCLTGLNIGGTEDFELLFTQGAMQQLRTLKLSFRMRRYGDMGLENLSSLEHVCVQTYYSDDHMKNALFDVIVESDW
jgi:hypothetical protein